MHNPHQRRLRGSRLALPCHHQLPQDSKYRLLHRTLKFLCTRKHPQRSILDHAIHNSHPRRLRGSRLALPCHHQLPQDSKYRLLHRTQALLLQYKHLQRSILDRAMHKPHQRRLRGSRLALPCHHQLPQDSKYRLLHRTLKFLCTRKHPQRSILDHATHSSRQRRLHVARLALLCHRQVLPPNSRNRLQHHNQVSPRTCKHLPQSTLDHATHSSRLRKLRGSRLA